MNTSRLTIASLLAFSLAAAPLSAANMEAPAGGFQLPMSAMLAVREPLRLQVQAQLQAVNASVNPAIPLNAKVSLDSVLNPQPVAAVTPAAAAVVRGLLAHPEAVQAHAAELKQVLGEQAFGTLSALIQGGHAQAAKDLLGAGQALNPADPGEPLMLAKLFDGFGAHATAAAPVAAGERHSAPLPASWRLSPHEKIHHGLAGEEEAAMAMLAKSLETMGLPPYKEKTVDAEVDAPTVAWAGLPSIWKLAIFREGGRQDPGNVLYALDSSWFVQVRMPDGKNRIFLTKGVYFEADGKQAVVVNYKTPRMVNYFGNYLTLGAFDTAAGVPLEEDLAAPMSSSSRLEKVTNDKLWTRLLLSAEGARVPASRAFLLPDHPFLRAGRAIPSSARVKAGAIPTSRDAVHKAVVEFLAAYDGPEVVVKPSGPRFHSGEGVKFFARDQVDAIADYVTELSKHDHMDSAGVVLLEQRLAPPPVYFSLTAHKPGEPFVYQDKKQIGVHIFSKSEMAAAQPHERKDSNERVWVVRGENDEPYTVPITFFRAGTWGKPTSGQPKDPRDAASVVPWEIIREALIKQYGIMSTGAEVAAFMKEREDIGVRALRAIMANEKTLAREKGEPYAAQTDMVGLDLMYQLENGRLVPYVIEVNDHDAAGQHAADLFYPEKAGQHSTKWVATMRARAAADYAAVHGK